MLRVALVAVCIGLSIGVLGCTASGAPARVAPLPSVAIDPGGGSSPPTAGPQAFDDRGAPVAPAVLRLVRAVYDAVIHANYGRLQQLLTKAACLSSVYQTQPQLWRQPGMLREMAAILRTHGAVTDGYTYPAFVLAGWQTDFDYQDAASLGVRPPASPDYRTPEYRGYATVFRDVAPGPLSWCGFYRNGS